MLSDTAWQSPAQEVLSQPPGYGNRTQRKHTLLSNLLLEVQNYPSHPVRENQRKTLSSPLRKKKKIKKKNTPNHTLMQVWQTNPLVTPTPSPQALFSTAAAKGLQHSDPGVAGTTLKSNIYNKYHPFLFVCNSKRQREK